MTRSERLAVAFGLSGIWIFTLILPVAETSGQKLKGLDILSSGFAGPFAGQFGWFANITFFLIISNSAQKNYDPNRKIEFIGYIHAICLISSFSWNAMYDGSGSTPITRFGAGYWIWTLLMGFTCFWPFVLNNITASTKGSEE